MLPKPPECLGCPAYGDGQGFVPDEIRPNADTLLMFQNPGAQEEEEERPLVGKTGQDMEQKYLSKLVGLNRQDVSLCNAIRCRIDHKNDLPPVDSVLAREIMAFCHRAHFKLPPGTKTALAAGDYASYQLTGDHSSSTWRGWAVPMRGTAANGAGYHLRDVWVPGPKDIPVLVTVHLARLYREPDLILPAMSDWNRLGRLRTHKWPVSVPLWDYAMPKSWPNKVSFDTEFDPETKALKRFSAAWHHGLAVVEADMIVPYYVSPGTYVVMQSAPADLYSFLKIADQHMIELHDTMLKHSVLHANLPHSLEFLGSVYSKMNRWKHLSDTNPIAYSAADAWGTLEVDDSLNRELDADPATKNLYMTVVRKLPYIIAPAERAGIRTWQPRVLEVAKMLRDDVEDAQQRAQAATGWPINLASNPQVGQHLYDIEGIKSLKGKKK